MADRPQRGLSDLVPSQQPNPEEVAPDGQDIQSTAGTSHGSSPSSQLGRLKDTHNNATQPGRDATPPDSPYNAPSPQQDADLAQAVGKPLPADLNGGGAAPNKMDGNGTQSGSPGSQSSGLDEPAANKPGVDADAVGDPLPESVTTPGEEAAESTADQPDSGTDAPDESPEAENDQESQPDDKDDNDNTGRALDEAKNAEGAEAGAAEGATAGGAEAAAGGAAAAETAEAAAAAAETAEVAGAGVAAAASSEVWVPVLIVCVVLLIVGLIAFLVIAGMSGASTGSSSSGSGTQGASTAQCKKLTGTPKNVVDKVALPVAHKIDFKNVTPESVEAANAVHGPTVSGGTSDHQGPPNVRWAADISNGTSPTPEMDQLAKDLADCFGFPPEQWKGDCNTTSKDGYRIQLIYRTDCGGNHWNHVHIGVAKE